MNDGRKVFLATSQIAPRWLTISPNPNMIMKEKFNAVCPASIVISNAKRFATGGNNP